MQWIVTYLTSSIGKKQIMGVTGAMIALWIFGHMVDWQPGAGAVDGCQRGFWATSS